MRRTILVSGANGYIAQHLIQFLRSQGNRVLTAKREESGELYMNFSNPDQLSKLQCEGIDIMIHTVSPGENLYRTNPELAYSENVTGIRGALDFCVRNKIHNFVYFSSFHVFGNQGGRLDENTPTTPINDYGLSHSIAEQIVLMYDRSNKLNGWIIRPSNVFGVPVDQEKFKRWNLIPFLFCKEAIEHQSITLLTPGTQLRNFVGISDICTKIDWILKVQPENRILHAQGIETLSVLEYARLVQKVAQDKYGIHVSVNCPKGMDNGIDFDFTSRWNQPNLTPTSELSTFIFDMLKSLHDRV
ncbi:NAD-dependent epimerase/dehydratase family protein [Paenibacillus herberti]|uniref:NAD-dependent epimerase n=1 Tax=Paenibacillus herberti TaxID=1619309 RepID=A0A229NWX7_9BACL|nr:SDR family oxidoreductase [Paenibacillus herberti]OXM14119.1 NAD-dependent epimerase [Paenibacillus herberti]